MLFNGHPWSNRILRGKANLIRDLGYFLLNELLGLKPTFPLLQSVSDLDPLWSPPLCSDTLEHLAEDCFLFAVCATPPLLWRV